MSGGRPVRARGARGFSLVELMIALVVLSIGIFAVGRLFPDGERGQTQDRLQSSAGYLAQEELERLSGLSWSDGELSLGRHPSGSAVQSCGANGRWSRWYLVEAMDAPLDDLKKLTVTVTWIGSSGRTVAVSTYVRR
jgi:prepilin-type N-terminal cleavage/methylation domain-containing protein